jgi:hypothetical protein
MTKAHRTKINRANAQHSTGPQTQAGKNRSALNSLRHGLTAQLAVMPTEDLAVYERHLKSFTDEYDPQGATEANLVQSLADTSWRLNRVAVLETNLLTQGIVSPPPYPSFRKKFSAMSIADSLASQCRSLSNLSMHSQRLSRQFERTVTQLRDLQKIRMAPSTSSKCLNPKEQSTTPPEMASFFQNPKSKPPGAGASAKISPSKPTAKASEPPPSGELQADLVDRNRVALIECQ